MSITRNILCLILILGVVISCTSSIDINQLRMAEVVCQRHYGVSRIITPIVVWTPKYSVICKDGAYFSNLKEAYDSFPNSKVSDERAPN